MGYSGHAFSISPHGNACTALLQFSQACLLSPSLFPDTKPDSSSHDCGAHPDAKAHPAVSIWPSQRAHRQALLPQTRPCQHRQCLTFCWSRSVSIYSSSSLMWIISQQTKDPPLHLIAYYSPKWSPSSSHQRTALVKPLFYKSANIFLSIRQKTPLIEICQQENKQAAFDMLLVRVWADK